MKTLLYFTLEFNLYFTASPFSWGKENYESDMNIDNLLYLKLSTGCIRYCTCCDSESALPVTSTTVYRYLTENEGPDTWPGTN